MPGNPASSASAFSPTPMPCSIQARCAGGDYSGPSEAPLCRLRLFKSLGVFRRGKWMIMSETPQQYSERIMKMIAGKDPFKTQSATPQKLARLVKSAPPSKLRKRPAPEKWSVAEILAHLADTEIVVGWRIRSILAAPGTPIQAFDQDAWAAAGNYRKRDPQKSIEQFRALRDAKL